MKGSRPEQAVLSRDTDMSKTEETRGVIEAMVDGLNDLRKADLDEFFAPDFTWHGNFGSGIKDGFQAFQDHWIDPFRTAFSNKLVVDEARMYMGEWAACFGYQEADHTGDLMGVAATGKRVVVPYVDFWKVVDGKIVDNWVSVDLAFVLAQVGHDVFDGKGWEGRDSITALDALASRQWVDVIGDMKGARPEQAVLTRDTDMSKTAETKRIIEDMVDGLNDHRIGDIGEFFAEDFRWLGNYGCGTKVGLTEFQENWQKPFQAAFSDKICVDEARLYMGEWAAAFGRQEAVHSGEFLGIAPTGKNVEIRYMDFWKVVDGKIVDNWVTVDFAYVLSQLGHDVFGGKSWETTDRDVTLTYKSA